MRIPQFNASASAQDEGELLLYPTLVRLGWVAHRDFQTFYGPGVFWALAALDQVTGDAFWSERAAALFLQLAIMGAIAALAWRFGWRTAVGAAGLSAIILWPLGLVAYAWVAALVLVGWSLVFLSAEQRTYFRITIAGLLMGLASLFRPDIIPAGIAGSLPWLVRLKPQERLAWAVGAMIGVAPWLPHVWVAGAGPVFQNLVVDPLFTTNSGRLIPIPSPGTQFFGLFAATTVLPIAAMAFVAWRTWVRPDDRDHRWHLGAALLSVGLIAQVVKRADLSHMIYTAAVATPLSTVVITDLAWPAARRFLPISAVVVAAALLAAESTTFLLPVAREARRFGTAVQVASPFVHHEGRTYPVYTPERASDIRLLLADIDGISHGGDRLIVLPHRLDRVEYGDTFLYYLAPRLTPGTYYLEMEPSTVNGPWSRLPQDLSTAKFLVLDSALDSPEPGADRAAVPAPIQSEVAARFCLTSVHGALELYVACSRPRA